MDHDNRLRSKLLSLCRREHNNKPILEKIKGSIILVSLQVILFDGSGVSFAGVALFRQLCILGILGLSASFLFLSESLFGRAG